VETREYGGDSWDQRVYREGRFKERARTVGVKKDSSRPAVSKVRKGAYERAAARGKNPNL
jgi:hypothetical protein